MDAADHGLGFLPFDWLTASSRDFLVISSRTTSSFSLVSFLRAWSWVTMVMSQPFTCEEAEFSYMSEVSSTWLFREQTVPSCGFIVQQLILHFKNHTPALFCLPSSNLQRRQVLLGLSWSHRCPVKKTNTKIHNITAVKIKQILNKDNPLIKSKNTVSPR